MSKKEEYRNVWLECNRLNLLLLEAVGENGLQVRYAARARDVRRTFVHMHNARLGWLGAVMKDPPQITRLKSREAHDLATLKAALQESGNAIADMLESIVHKQQVPGFERSPLLVLTYMTSHEAHHRGQIIVALRLAGKALPREMILSLWDYQE
jgi:uncharacterized damage-inducible protein DinB